MIPVARTGIVISMIVKGVSFKFLKMRVQGVSKVFLLERNSQLCTLQLIQETETSAGYTDCTRKSWGTTDIVVLIFDGDR